MNSWQPWDSYYYHTHFLDEDTEAYWDSKIRSGSFSQQVAEPECEPSLPDNQVCILSCVRQRQPKSGVWKTLSGKTKQSINDAARTVDHIQMLEITFPEKSQVMKSHHPSSFCQCNQITLERLDSASFWD